MSFQLYKWDGGEWTTYPPPKRTAFGHTARWRDPMVAWERTRVFMETHCLLELSRLPLQVLCLPAGPCGTSERASAAAREQATLRFGEPVAQPTPSRVWNIDASRIDETIEFCARINAAWPDQKRGPLLFAVSWELAWKAPAANGLAESASDAARNANQAAPAEVGHASSLRPGFSNLIASVFGRELFLQPSLTFPFAWDSTGLAGFLATIEPACPFRSRDTYFHRLIPSARGELRHTRRLPKGWRHGAGKAYLGDDPS